MTDRAPTDILPAETAMGAVTLLVDDLDRMTAYYRDAVTLQVLSATDASLTNDSVTDATVTLGRGSTPVLVLERNPGLAPAALGAAGLFHTAIVFDSQAALAAAVYSVATRAPGTFTGSSDHLVSQAFYFTDPEGNGVELYWDRDRTAWSWVHGRIEMATLHLDPNRFIAEHLSEVAPTGPAAVGHVHLSVGDVGAAREFYVRRLGFETTAEFGGSALFVSAGGYHHHMAMNTWNSRGAGRRTRALGLGRVDIVLPGADDLGEVRERMAHYSVAVRDDGRALAFDDPWGNTLALTSALAARRGTSAPRV